MNREEIINDYQENIEFLRKNIAPDDIYEFAEQALICSEYFLLRWMDWIDITEECLSDKQCLLWVNNITGIREMKKKGYVNGIKINPLFIEDD